MKLKSAASGARLGGALLVGLATLHASALPSLIADLNRLSLGVNSEGLKASWLIVSISLAITGVSAITCRRSDHDSRHLPILHATLAHAAWLNLLAFLGLSPPTFLAAAAALLLTLPILQRMSAK